MCEMCIGVQDMPTRATVRIKKVISDSEVITIKNVGQCGKLCPDNGPDHRGQCYLDFGHTQMHTCSVDGGTWDVQ
jgi:hypothetical protein